MKRNFAIHVNRVILLLLCVVLVISCTACGQPNTSSNQQQENNPNAAVAEKEPIEITMWTFLDPNGTDGRGQTLKKIIEDYEKEFPYVTVSVETQDYTTLTTKFLTASAVGNAPDICWVESTRSPLIIEDGHFIPFEDMFLDEWSDEDIADVKDSFWDMAGDGKHYTAYMSRNSVSIVYRQDLFEEKGIDPNSIKSWDDLVEAAKKLTYVDENGMQVYGLGQNYAEGTNGTNYVIEALLSTDQLFTPDGTAVWNNETAVDAINYQKEMIEMGITPEYCVSATFDDVVTDFIAGKYAMIMSGNTRVPKIKEACAYDPDAVQCMLIPQLFDDTDMKIIAGGWMVGVWSESEHPYEAGKFLEAMISREADCMWVETGGQIPMRQSTRETLKDYFADPDNAYLLVAQEALTNHAWMYPNNFDSTGLYLGINRAFNSVMVNGEDPMQALTQTAEDFNIAAS